MESRSRSDGSCPIRSRCPPRCGSECGTKATRRFRPKVRREWSVRPALQRQLSKDGYSAHAKTTKQLPISWRLEVTSGGTVVSRGTRVECAPCRVVAQMRPLAMSALSPLLEHDRTSDPSARPLIRTLAGVPEGCEIAPEPAGHGLPLSKCEAYGRTLRFSNTFDYVGPLKA